MDEENVSTWNIGDTFAKITAGYFDYKTQQAANATHWTPYGPGGTQLGVGANGEVFTRGAPATSSLASLVSALIPIALGIGAVYLAYRAIKG